MAYVVLVAWAIQAAVGALLLARWLRGARPSARLVVAHVALGFLIVALWLVFLTTSSLVAAWLAFAAMSIGNAIGDTMLIRRWRRMRGSTAGYWADYGGAIGAVFRGAMPPRVTFHALFAGVVYFLALGVTIGASVA